MCGIAGVLSPSRISQEDIDTISRMNDLQRHRGPDDEGLFVDDFCVLGHRRLSIIDLSANGHQPFQSEDGRYYLVYNGEIYNYIEIRRELEAKNWQFRTKTDTEVLLKAFLEYGEDCLSHFNGMFSFVIYDKKEHTLFMARDRFGVKPLYYTQFQSKLFFASEIKAFRTIAGLSLTPCHRSLFDYFCFNRTDVFEETFINEIKRLPKGHKARYANGSLIIKQWWNPETFASREINDSEETIFRTIEDIFISAINLRMRSDVPVGGCLSGGLDSSIIVGALAQTGQTASSFKTFTASFPGTSINETKYVDALALRYPFENYRVYPTAKSAFEHLQAFVYTNDEPTTSPSYYAQYEVMRLAHENKVTVLLDGQGGDESFAGYQYFHGFYLYGLLRQRKLSNFLSELFQIIIRHQDITAYQTLLFQILPHNMRQRLLYGTLPYISHDFFYEHIDGSRIYNEFFAADSLNQSLVRHFQYKLEHLLRMEDRNSMAFSLETRVPYLDYRLVEYILGISEKYKIHAGETKYLQKKALGKYTVPDILNRKDKLGFETPVDNWMRQPSWSELTADNFSDLKKSFPEIFVKNAPVPEKGYDCWKINQLATWKNICLS